MVSNAFEVVLIGDTGEIRTDGTDPVLRLFKEQLPSNENSLVIFLGDLIYPKGLPPEHDSMRKHAEKVLNYYHTLLKDFKGKNYSFPAITIGIKESQTVTSMYFDKKNIFKNCLRISIFISRFLVVPDQQLLMLMIS